MTFLADRPETASSDDPGAMTSDIDALVVAVAEHRNALVGLAVTLLRDQAAAQDAVQDVLAAMLRVHPRLADEAAALAYARAAVVNRCRSMLRRRVTATKYLDRLAGVAHAPSADEAVLLADEHRHLLDLFYRLPRRQREALGLRYFAQLSDAEIAEALGVSPSTVRSNVSRGLAALSSLYEVNPHV
jgi:RNA polymerase sigma factor (sigma-70 family)